MLIRLALATGTMQVVLIVKKVAITSVALAAFIEKEVANTQDSSNINVAGAQSGCDEGQVSYASSDKSNHTLWLDGARTSAQSWVLNETVYVFTDSGRDKITLVDIMAHVAERCTSDAEWGRECQDK